MQVPALHVARPPRLWPARAAAAGGALAASVVATLTAVAVALIAQVRLGVGLEMATAFAVAATAAVPGLGMILHGLHARGAARVIAGGLLLAPALALHFLFLDVAGHATLPLLAALLAACGALSAWQLERRLGLWGWWAAGVAAVAALWCIGALGTPAQVWVEWPAPFAP
jgi:hypothetical protein